MSVMKNTKNVIRSRNYKGWQLTWDKLSRIYIAKKGGRELHETNRVGIERLIDKNKTTKLA